MMENATAVQLVPRLIAWELTRRCNLSCRYCKADADDNAYIDELSTAECKSLIKEIAEHCKAALLFTGGEPLMRADVFELAECAAASGLPVVLATNGTMLNVPVACRLQAAGVRRLGVSIDGKDAHSHDAFRNVPGCFDAALEGIRHAKTVGLPFQFTTTVTRRNFRELTDILGLAKDLGAAALELSLAVASGQSRPMRGLELSAPEYEQVLDWFARQQAKSSLELTAGCVPMFGRYASQQLQDESPRSCPGGTSACFISHTGRVFPCGCHDLDCGTVRDQGLVHVWRHSPVFENLRHIAGKQGGCRAKACAHTADYEFLKQPQKRAQGKDDTHQQPQPHQIGGSI